MAKGGGGTTQETTVQQQTSVTVQNVIQGQQLEPLQRVQLLAEIFSTLDKGNKPQTPQTVIIPTAGGSSGSFLKDPNFIALMIVAAFGLVVVAKKLK